MAQIFMNFMLDPNSYIRIYIGLNAWILTQNLLTKHGTIRGLFMLSLYITPGKDVVCLQILAQF